MAIISCRGIPMKVRINNYLDFTRTPDFQQVLTEPNLFIAARFWEDERYDAAKICYQAMRFIDDLIDIRKATAHDITDVEKHQFMAIVNKWVTAVNNARPCDMVQKSLIETITKFQIPLWPWQRFSKSMIYDIHHNGFQSISKFLSYAEGAAVAPASIFMHLCGIVKDNNRYYAPRFDIKEAARPAALFSYLVHVIRDFQKDQNNHLNYFATDLLSEYGLNQSMLRDMANGGSITPGFRNLMEKYYVLAEKYLHKTRQMIDKTIVYLEPRYQLSLEIIYSLYRLVFERINISNGRFTTEELNPSHEEIKDQISYTVSNFEPVK